MTTILYIGQYVTVVVHHAQRNSNAKVKNDVGTMFYYFVGGECFKSEPLRTERFFVETLKRLIQFEIEGASPLFNRRK